MSLDYSNYMQGGYQTLAFDQRRNPEIDHLDHVINGSGYDWEFYSPPSSSKNKFQKRRRAKNSKNKEEMENERMAHIAVERNRRRLMNDYLATLRSLMPPSYAQRGDQSSIVGGAINFVKELEQLLHC